MKDVYEPWPYTTFKSGVVSQVNKKNKALHFYFENLQ
jgi:hypothetical protein